MGRLGSKRKRLTDNEPSSRLWQNVKVVGIVTATLLGVLLAWWLPMMMPFGVSVHTSKTTVTISYSLSMYVMYLLAGGGMILAALKLGFERQLYHWLVLGGGIVVTVFGMLYAALEKVEVSQHSCSSRSWFGLSHITLQFADLEEFKQIQHERKAGRWFGGSSRGPRPSKMVYVTKAGEEGIFLASYYPTSFYSDAYAQLLLAWSFHGKGLTYPYVPKN